MFLHFTFPFLLPRHPNTQPPIYLIKVPSIIIVIAIAMFVFGFVFIRVWRGRAVLEFTITKRNLLFVWFWSVKKLGASRT